MTHIASLLITYLLNSLWQVPLLFAAAWLAARLARAHGSTWEHRIWVTALVGQVLLPLGRLPANLGQRILAFLPLPQWFAPAGQESIRVIVGPGTPASASAPHLPLWLLAAIIIGYLWALLFFAARLVWQLYTTYRLLRIASPLAATSQVKESVARCARQIGIPSSGVRLLVSASVPGPVTAGVFHGTVLVPPGFLETLSAEDRDAVLMHEFAHLSRHDFAKNLLYQVLALPAAWHPMLWLTGSRLAESRELVCDAIAARAAQGEQQYARSLLRLAAAQSSQRPASIHALGIFETHSLERRIMQLTQSRIQSSLTRRLLTLSTCALLAIATAASAVALHVEAAVPMHAALHASQPLHVSPGAMAGNRISGENPKYPPEAKKKHIQGEVTLMALISKDGSIEHVKSISGPRMLIPPSIEAVRTWRYKPYLLNGEPVEVETKIHVIYNLGGPRKNGEPPPPPAS